MRELKDYSVKQLEALARRLRGMPPAVWDDETVSGALAAHVAAPTADFQPMNANYGILRPLAQPVRDKALKKRLFAERALGKVRAIVQETGRGLSS